MSEARYRPEIDGLRAFAVVPVVLFHLGVAGFPGGYLGVDVFFVISGFLITGILLRELESGNFSLKAFWMRRIRRIWPALLAMVLVVCAASCAIVFRPQLASIGGDALAAILSYANLSMYLKHGDYWGTSAASSLFLHTWSLSIEEQFYLFYPLFLLLVWKLRLGVVRSIAAIMVASFALFAYLAYTHPVLCFYILPSRAWELACGGLAAAVSIRSAPGVPDRLRALLASLGLIAVVASNGVSGNSESISLFTVVPVLGSAAILLFTTGGTWVHRVLSSPPVVYVGRISYSLYLWHWPVIVLARALEHSFTIPVPVLVVVIALLSVASYHGIETPTRRMRRILLAAVPMFVAATGFALALRLLPAPVYDVSKFHPVSTFGGYYDIVPHIPPDPPKLQSKLEGVIEPKRDPRFALAYAEDGIPGAHNRGRPARILVLGDSHGSMWAKTIEEACGSLDLPVAFFTMVGQDPFFHIPLDSSNTQGDAFREEESRIYKRNLLSKLASGNLDGLVVADRWTIRGESDYQFLEELLRYASRHRVASLVIAQPPQLATGENNVAQYFAYLGMDPTKRPRQFFQVSDEGHWANSNAKVRAICSRVAGCQLFDPVPDLLRGHAALAVDGPDIVYFDDNHLTYHGTNLFRRKLERKLATLPEEHRHL